MDVQKRVPDGITRLMPFTVREPIVVANEEEALRADIDKECVDGLLVSIYQPVSEKFLNYFSRLRYIGVLGTSTKKLPLSLCKERGITVTNVTQYCDEDTAEWVMMQALVFFRTRSPVRSAANKTLGVIGVGAVGRQIMRYAEAFHMSIAFNSNREHPDLVERGMMVMTKEDIFKHCDVVTLHTPAFLSWLTYPMLMHAREHLCVINTCMGRVAQDHDLERALKERADITLIMDSIAGAAYPELSKRAQIFPEAAYATQDSSSRLIEKFFANLAQFA